MIHKIKKYMIGSDIEFFLQNKESGEIVSAEGIIEGSKHEPHRFDPANEFFATSLDNVMAEGNIPPSTTPAEFYHNVERLMEYINAVIPKELQTISVPSARLNYKYLQTDNAQIFGCEPSLQCWTGEMVQPQPTGDNVRSSGFHLHIGYDKPSEETNIALMQAMDLHLGLPAVLLEPENERKSVGYGHAGNFRHTRYGAEYRVLSGYFASSRHLIEWCFNQAILSINFINNGNSILLNGLGDEIQRIINTEDKVSAKAMMDQFEIILD